MPMKRSLVAASALWLLTGYAAQAADFAKDNYLFGDWGGTRTKLHDAGIDVSLSYGFQTGGNLSGGQRHATSYADQTVLALDYDLDKLLGLSGGSFRFSLTNRGGQAQNINNKAEIGQLMQSLEVYGRGRVTRISEFYYQQDLLDGDLRLKLGRMNVGAEFGSFQCEFAYLGFCGSQPGNFNSTIYNWPISQWAAVARYNLNEEWYLKGGVYQMNPSWLENEQRLNFGNPHGTVGMTLPVELGWTPKLNGLDGTYKLGYWYDTAGGNDLYYNSDDGVLLVDGGSPRQKDHKGGAYLVAEQQLTSVGGDSSRGLSLFATATFNDRDLTTVDRSLALGLTYKGPFAARAQDQWGLAVKYLHVSDRLSDGQRALALALNSEVPVQDSETVVASYYKFQVTPYLAVRPELQYIHNPGGLSENDNAWVAVLKGDIAF